MSAPRARALRSGRRALFALAVSLVTLTTVAAEPIAAEPAPEPAVPTFVNGHSQAVFPTGSANWVNHELWVETEVDSDFDGKLDRIHVDVSRVRETDTDGLKVPVIMEVSPYYGGSVERRQLGGRPRDRLPAGDAAVRAPNVTNDEPARSRPRYEATWVPRGFAVVHVGGARERPLRRLLDLRRPNETLGPKAVVDWLNGRAKGYTVADRHDRGRRELDDRQGRDDRHVVQRHAADRRRLDRGRGPRGDRPDLGDLSWYDYYRANGAVRAPGGFQGEDLDVLAEYTYTRSDQQICRPVIADIVAQQDRATGDYEPVLGRAQLHERRRQGAGRDARRARQQRLERDDEARRAVLRGDQGARRPAPALLAPGRARRLAADVHAEPLVHAVPLERRRTASRAQPKA